MDQVIMGVVAAGALSFAALALYAIYAAWRLYRPKRAKIERTPADFGMPFERLSFQAADGHVKLSGWLIRALHATRRGHTIILCHQWGAHKGFGLPYARFYHEAGFDVVAFDLRNHGNSGRDLGLISMSTRFTNDVRGAVDAAGAHPMLKGNKLSLHAFSFSTFPAMVAALDATQGGIDSLVLDSGPTLFTRDITYGFFDAIGVKLLPSALRLPMIYPLFRSLFATAALAMLATDWPTPQLKGARVPALFIGGEADTIARPVKIEPVLHLIADGTLLIVPGAKHLGALRKCRDSYIRTVLAFHDRLGKAPADPVVG